jgi:hypothetical protein
MFNSVLLAGPSYTVEGAILCTLKSGFTDGNEWRWAMDSEFQSRWKREVTL